MKTTGTSIPHKRYSTIILTVLVGIVLAFSSFYYVRYQELLVVKTKFNLDAHNRLNAIDREIDANVAVIQSLQSFFAASEEVTREEFLHFSISPLQLHYDIQALEWIPRVSHLEKGIYEQKARNDGYSEFQITERNINGEIIRAGERKEYFPVYFLEPFKGNEVALGYDLASDKTRLEALNKSRDTGKIVATPLISLVQEASGFLVLIPVYQNRLYLDTVNKRRENLLGFVMGVFNINEFIEQALSYLEPTGIDIYIIDESSPPGAGFLYSHSSRMQSNEKQPVNQKEKFKSIISLSQTIYIADRKWKIVASPIPQYLAHTDDWHAWAVSMTVLLITGFLTAYLRISLTRTVYIESLLGKITFESDVRKRTADNLRESEERYHSLISNIPSVTWITSNKGETTFISPNIENIYGYSAEEIYANGESLWLGRIHSEDIDIVKEAYGNLFKEEGQFDIQYRIQRKDGEWIWLHDRAMTTYEKEGTQFAYGVFSDITEQKKSELILLESERRSRETLTKLNMIAVQIDKEGNITFANNYLLDLSGWNMEEIIDKNWIDIFIEDKNKINVKKIHKNNLETGEIQPTFENNIVCKNGQKRLIKWTNSRLLDLNNKIIGITSIGEDITEHKLAEEKLKQYQENLEEMVRDRTNELEEKTRDLENFNQLFVEREFRIKELRDKIIKLEEDKSNK